MPLGVVADADASEMSGFGFDTLALLAVIGLAGPLLAAVPRLRHSRRWSASLVVGIIVGRTGFGVVDHTDPTFTLLANIGFALVMFVVGTHVPVRDSDAALSDPEGAGCVRLSSAPWRPGSAVRLADGLRDGTRGAVRRADGVVVGGFGAADHRIAGPGRTAGAVGDRADRHRRRYLNRVAALGDRLPARATGGVGCAGHRGLRGGAFPGASGRPIGGFCGSACTTTLKSIGSRWNCGSASSCCSAWRRWPSPRTCRSCWRVSRSVWWSSAIGEPRRLARQLFGITEGFFSPLFFVWLGASLQVRELGDHPGFILLGAGLGVGAVLAHCAGRLLGQPLTLAALAAAQLGVPVAAATLGTEQHLLAPGEPSALMLGALLTIAVTSVAGVLAARRHSGDTSGDTTSAENVLDAPSTGRRLGGGHRRGEGRPA